MAKYLSQRTAQWQHTMLRIKDPKRTIPFYDQHFGMKLIHFYHFPEWKFSLYFMGHFPEGQVLPEPGTVPAEKFLWTMPYNCLEFTHNHGTESDDSFAVNNGNVEPHRGFGHIAMMTKDVQAACDEMEANGVLFQKKPNEGRMKGLAFVLDPDGYWVEIITRDNASTINNKFTLAQTMLRVKDIKKSLAFYRDILGMTVLSEKVMGEGTDWGFSLYFLAHISEEDLAALPENKIGNMFGPILELTYNHGTEKLADFRYHDGNATSEGQRQGYGHCGFLVDDLHAACAELDALGIPVKKRESEGAMRGIAFYYDPDGYHVELVQKGVRFLKD